MRQTAFVLTMKHSLLAALLGASLAATAGAQTFTAPVDANRTRPRERPAPAISREPVTGVIPRAFRGGNPLQMLNPRAPARYGTAEQSVVFDPFTGKWRGIKLFTFNF